MKNSGTAINTTNMKLRLLVKQHLCYRMLFFCWLELRFEAEKLDFEDLRY